MDADSRQLIRLALDQIRQLTRRRPEAVMGLFQTITAAQPAAVKRQRVSDEQLTAFIADLAARFPARSSDIIEAGRDEQRPSVAHLDALRVMLDLRPPEVADHPGPEVALPVQFVADLAAWNALMDLSEFRRQGWTLVGGQMVRLLAWEHGEESPRVTTDADVVVDVRAYQTALRDVTQKLLESGFAEDGVSPDGIGHRYRHREAKDARVDVLLPEGVRPERYVTVTGARTIAVAGSVQALERSMRRRIEIGGRHGSVIRPDVHAALVGKAAGYQAERGTVAAERHLRDFAYLTSLFARHYPVSELRERLTSKDRIRIANVLGNLLSDNTIWRTVPDGQDARALVVASLHD